MFVISGAGEQMVVDESRGHEGLCSVFAGWFRKATKEAFRRGCPALRARNGRIVKGKISPSHDDVLEDWHQRSAVRGKCSQKTNQSPLTDFMVTRKETVSRLRDQVARGIPIIGAGAGTGISAKCEELGGADLIIIYNSGRFRMAGRGSIAGLMPYGDANQIVVEMAREVIPVVKNIPVLAGVCGTDPFRLMPNFLEELKKLGFSGVQNFPTVGLFEGQARRNMEETGMGYDREVEMIKTAHDLDLLTTPYVFNPSEASAMAKAGADIIVAHVGTTLKGTIGARSTISLDDAIVAIQAMHDAAKKANPDVLVIFHGGPIAEPEDVAYVLERTNGIVGFYGASSMERLPVEIAITENMKRFKKLHIQKDKATG
jgi:predicted TIM-barrel enzyme